MSPESRLVADALEAAERVARSLKLSMDELAGRMPVMPAEVNDLDRRTEIGVLAFLKSFEQLQDVMSRRLFRAILAEAGEDVGRMTALDTFSRLARIGAIEDAERFNEITKLRHRLAHEYPMEDEKRARRINEAWEFAPVLLAELRNAAAFIDRGKTEDRR